MTKEEEGKLDGRVRSLETTRTVIIGVCLIFGVSGAWGYKVLQTAKRQLDGLVRKKPPGPFTIAAASA